MKRAGVLVLLCALVVGAISACTGKSNRESRSPTISSDSVATSDWGVVPETVEQDAGAAAAAIRDYYAAIQARDFERAWKTWSSEGAASGKTLDEFARGFDSTATVQATVGAPGPIEGAAGSRYIEIPVEVRARTVQGADQHFRGPYVLRRSVVDGATAEQRRWRIYSARLVPVKP
jgi:hypothetical protein